MLSAGCFCIYNKKDIPNKFAVTRKMKNVEFFIRKIKKKYLIITKKEKIYVYSANCLKNTRNI